MITNKKWVLLLWLLLPVAPYAQTTSTDEKAIRGVLEEQVKAWNDFDLTGFMEGYWKSDSLAFFGKTGITRGWQQTLERYQKGYPDRRSTGQLRFKIEELNRVTAESYYVMGRFYLSREVGDAEGVFLLVFKKIDGAWKIVADMSCG